MTVKIERLVGEIHRTENAVEELKKNTYSRKINTNSMLLVKAFEVINSKVGLSDTSITKIVLQKLFKESIGGKHSDESGYLLKIKEADFPALVVNNFEKLYRDIREALQGSINQEKQRNNISIETVPYKLPNQYDVKIDTRIKTPAPYKKNAYETVDESIKSSVVEKEFNRFLDEYEGTEWWMKNGDTGDEMLSVVYHSFRKRISILSRLYL